MQRITCGVCCFLLWICVLTATMQQPPFQALTTFNMTSFPTMSACIGCIGSQEGQAQDPSPPTSAFSNCEMTLTRDKPLVHVTSTRLPTLESWPSLPRRQGARPGVRNRSAAAHGHNVSPAHSARFASSWLGAWEPPPATRHGETSASPVHGRHHTDAGADWEG